MPIVVKCYSKYAVLLFGGKLLSDAGLYLLSVLLVIWEFLLNVYWYMIEVVYEG
jgi:hypothetical protein